MVAIRSITAIAGVALLMGCTGLHAKNENEFAKEQAAFNATSQCLSAIDVELKPALSSPPKFASLKEAVRWTRSHLPREFDLIFERAGIALKKKANGVALSNLARNRGEFQRLIYPLVAAELESYKGCQAGDAGLAVPDKVANLLNLTLKLNEEPLRSQFAALGLDDSYYIEQAFLILLTLDATGESWDDRWVARDPVKK